MNKHEKALWLRARMAKAQATQGVSRTPTAPTSYTRADTACRTQELEWEDDGGCEHQRIGVTYAWTITESTTNAQGVERISETEVGIRSDRVRCVSDVASREQKNSIVETDNAKDSVILASSSPYRTSRYSLEEVRDRLVSLRQASALKWKMLPSEICNDEQLDAAAKTVWRFGELRNKNGALLHNTQAIAPTGAGKTRYYGMVLQGLREIYTDLFPLNRLAIFCAPKAVIDSGQAAQEFCFFGDILLNTIIVSLPSLRASLGDNFVEWKTVIVNELPVIYPFWKADFPPAILIVDESQQVKNETSDQAKVLESAAVHGIPILYGSATPYSRPCQAKIIACALRPTVPFGNNKHGVPLDVNIWPPWVRNTVHPKDPAEWSPTGLRRVQEWLEPHTVRFSCTYPHKIISKLSICYFKNQSEIDRYTELFNEWQRVREERGKDPLVGIIAELVALQKFNQGAEEIRAPHLVDAAIELYQSKEKSKLKAAMVLGFVNKTALDIAYKRLLERGISPDLISVICGGQTDRPKQVARFKSDKAHFCLLTIASGGAGLDLGHNKYNKRQRFMFASAVWNDIQFVQLAGRCQRMNSRSATYLYIVAYSGTEEMSKLNKMLRKTRALKEVVTPIRSATIDDAPTTFIDASDNLECDNTLLAAPPREEEEEDAAAGAVIGTRANLEFVTEEDE